MEETRQRVPAPEQPRGGLPSAIAAEWTRLRGLKSTWIGLGAVVVGGAVMALLVAVSLRGPDTDGTSPGVIQISPQLTAAGAVQVAQFAVIPMAALIATAEYATGAIRTTLIPTPHRARMLTAKVAVLSAVAFAAGCWVGVSASVVAPVVSDTESLPHVSDVLEAMAGTGYYLACVSLSTLGLGLLTRRTAAAISTMIGMLVSQPILWAAVVVWVPDIATFMPSPAGMDLIADSDATGALVLAGWAALPLAFGYAALSRRDT